MARFDNEWLRFIHCLLVRLSEVDEWVFHKIIYELSKFNIIEVDHWVWYGNWPRSSLIDAVLSLFTLSGIVKYNDGKLIIKRSPNIECIFDDKTEKVVENILSTYCGSST